MPLKPYPGDRGDRWLEEEDVELAKLYLKEGLPRFEVVRIFRDNGYTVIAASDVVFHAGREMGEK